MSGDPSSNPYLPPQASVEPDGPTNEIQQVEKLRLRKERPIGLVVLVGLFGVVSLGRTVVELAEGGFWWMLHIAISVGILYAYRGLWSGNEAIRKSAVWLCLLLALMIIVFGVAEPSVHFFSALGIANVLESVFFLFAGAYLVKASDHPFFSIAPTLTTGP